MLERGKLDLSQELPTFQSRNDKLDLSQELPLFAHGI